MSALRSTRETGVRRSGETKRVPDCARQRLEVASLALGFGNEAHQLEADISRLPTRRPKSGPRPRATRPVGRAERLLSPQASNLRDRIAVQKQF